jgi:hypothetical protein
MDFSGAVGDACEVLANIGGKRGNPGSCALKALPNIQEGHVGTSWVRYCRSGCYVVRGDHCFFG